MMTPNRAKRRLYWIGFAILVITTSIAVFYPFYWMLSSSFAPEGSSLSRTYLLVPPSVSLGAYRTMFERKPLLLWIGNTFVVTVGSAGIAVPLALLAGYSLTRFRFRGRTAVIFFVLLAQLLPITSIVVPLFMAFRTMKLLDTMQGLIIAYMSFMLPLAIWILWGYLQSIPIEFEEAALVDGCNRFNAFVKVTVPLALPGIASTMLYCFLEGWNQYFLAYVLTGNEDKWVISLGLFSFIGEYVVEIEQMMASAVIAAIPALVVFIILQQFVRGGLSLGGLKG